MQNIKHFQIMIDGKSRKNLEDSIDVSRYMRVKVGD